MIETLYIEEAVLEHPRTLAIRNRFPRARVVPCQRYGEVFNRSAQNFRLQKQKPSLILARKHEGLVLPAPEGYGVGGSENFYFSHMLNCLYDCRYCFLQGMYRSAHYVLFVNYEDFGAAVAETASSGSEPYFFSGYDCDSLAMEPVTGFVDWALPLFRDLPHAWLELRTKSTQVRGLLAQEPLANVVVAFSLAPPAVADTLEHKAPPLERRLEALARLQVAGWPIGLRFDPLVYFQGFEPHYRAFFEQVFHRLDPRRLHSVSLGSFRLPQSYFARMVKLYPRERLFAGALEERRGMVGYETGLEQRLMDFCERELRRHVPADLLFPAAA